MYSTDYFSKEPCTF